MLLAVAFLHVDCFGFCLTRALPAHLGPKENLSDRVCKACHIHLKHQLQKSTVSCSLSWKVGSKVGHLLRFSPSSAKDLLKMHSKID